MYIREEARENALKFGADISYSPETIPEEYFFPKYKFGGHALGPGKKREMFLSWIQPGRRICRNGQCAAAGRRYDQCERTFGNWRLPSGWKNLITASII